LRDLRGGIWQEIDGGSVVVETARRNIQNAYLDLVDAKLNAAPDARDRAPVDAQALLRQELGTLDAAIRRALPRAGNELTRAHLQHARVRIGRILEPKS
jgi:hypothetical protein